LYWDEGIKRGLQKFFQLRLESFYWDNELTGLAVWMEVIKISLKNSVVK